MWNDAHSLGRKKKFVTLISTLIIYSEKVHWVEWLTNNIDLAQYASVHMIYILSETVVGER